MTRATPQLTSDVARARLSPGHPRPEQVVEGTELRMGRSYRLCIDECLVPSSVAPCRCRRFLARCPFVRKEKGSDRTSQGPVLLT